MIRLKVSLAGIVLILPYLTVAQSLDKEYVRMNGEVVVVRKAAPIIVSVTPTNAVVDVGLTAQFFAVVQNASNPAVTWSINPAIGSINGSGLYSATTPVSQDTNISVTATSVQDVTRSATVTMLLRPAIAVSITPVTVTLGSGTGAYQFSATNQLAGPFTTLSANVGMGPAKFSAQYSYGGGIWQFVFGPPGTGASAGVSVSRVTTTTTVFYNNGCR